MSARRPKILAVASAVDLDFRYGCTPAWWQLWKGLYQAGCDLIVTPYRGRAVESPWWRTEPNPCFREAEAFATARAAVARLRGDRYLGKAAEHAERGHSVAGAHARLLGRGSHDASHLASRSERERWLHLVEAAGLQDLREGDARSLHIHHHPAARGHHVRGLRLRHVDYLQRGVRAGEIGDLDGAQARRSYLCA